MAEILIIGGLLLVWYVWPRSPKRQTQTSTHVQVPTAIPTSAPDQDAWEGSFWEVTKPFPVTAKLKFEYTDGNGAETSRTVTIRQVGSYGPDSLLIGHCHLRHATRTFLVARMRNSVDADTGEIVADVVAYLRAQYDASPEKSICNLLEAEYDTLRVLLFIGKADGQLRREEKVVICQACIRLSQDDRLTPKHIDDIFAFMGVPTLQAFKMAVGRLALRPDDFTRALLDAAESIVATQKTLHPAEADALAYLRKRFTQARTQRVSASHQHPTPTR